jgi:ankyrin repeat protein
MTRDSIFSAWTFAQHDDLHGLESLVPSEVDPNSSTHSLENHVHTLLMAASAHGALSCASYLVEQGASVDQKNFLGFTALHWTAFTGRTEVVDLLLEHGADIEARTEDGKTTVHIAAARGHIQYLRYILAKGADLMAIASNGWTALQFSVVGNFQKVCQFLLSRNCDPGIFDVGRKTVFDIAQLYNRSWAIRLFQPMLPTEDEDDLETEPTRMDEEEEPPPVAPKSRDRRAHV